MEFCSIDDAFPDLATATTARKEERRKAKKCRGPALTFLEPDTGLLPVTDPDRPAKKPLPEVPPMNPLTGLREHSPVDAPQAEAFADTSEYEKLLAALRSEQAPAKQEAVLNTLPHGVAGPNKLEAKPVPSFFGANDDDEDGVQEGFSSFTNIIGDDPNYKLSPDFGKTFEGRGTQKATGSTLPPVPSNMFWKPLVSGTKTSFYSKIEPSSGSKLAPAPAPLLTGDQGEVLRKLDKIFARLDDLEGRKSENANTEVMLFVMSGLFVMFTMDLLVRKAGNVRLMH